jgi:hypothetical protein
MCTTSFGSPLQALKPIWFSKLSIYMEFDEAQQYGIKNEVLFGKA